MAGPIIMIICCWGSALLFLTIGTCAARSEKPMHFWSGTTVDPATISDIPAYNHANGRMWALYSVPYWICGVFGGLEIVFHSAWFPIACLIVMVLACTVGMWWLVRTYKSIEKKYKVNQEKS